MASICLVADAAKFWSLFNRANRVNLFVDPLTRFYFGCPNREAARRLFEIGRHEAYPGARLRRRHEGKHYGESPDQQHAQYGNHGIVPIS